MKKSKEQLEAEQIVAGILRHTNAMDALQKAREWATLTKYAIAQRVTVTIMLCTLWDYYEDFNEKDVKDLYDMYLAYHKSFNEGHEDIFKQMQAIDEMLDGALLKEKFFDTVRSKVDER